MIRSFTDKASQEHYAVGEKYPHRGIATRARIEELSTVNNRRGVVLIKAVDAPEKAAEQVVEEKLVEVVEPPVEAVEEPKKRTRKKK